MLHNCQKFRDLRRPNGMVTEVQTSNRLNIVIAFNSAHQLFKMFVIQSSFFEHIYLVTHDTA